VALSYETLPGDIDRLIADDHAVANRLFEHLEDGRGDRRLLADQVSYGRALHADAEEEVLYPAMVEAGQPAKVQEGRDEHQQAKEMLVLLDHTSPGTKDFEESLVKLIASVRRHMDKEEREFLPALRRAVGAEEMGRLGERFIAAKGTAPSRAHRQSRGSRVVRRLGQAGSAALDKVRDKASGRSNMLATDASGLLDPQAQRLLDTFSMLEPLPYENLTSEQARQQPTLADAVLKLRKRNGRAGQPERVGAVEDVTLPGPGGDLPARVYKPVEAGNAPLPVVLWIHGGGWVLHTNDTYDASCRALVNRTGAIVVSPEYRKAPEHVFPAAHDDVLATCRWVRANAARLGVDASRIAIGGEGVGGNMAAATCLQLNQSAEPPPVAQVLVYPLTTMEQFGDSMTNAAEAKPLNRPRLSWLTMHAFRGTPASLKDPRVNLLSLSVDQLRGLPPTLVITVDRDVLQSQGGEFARRLREAGVPTATIRYGGVMHDFFGAAAVLEKAAHAQQEVAQHLRLAFDPASAAQLHDVTAPGHRVIG
jgi:acetyl esterase